MVSTQAPERPGAPAGWDELVESAVPEPDAGGSTYPPQPIGKTSNAAAKATPIR